MSSARVGRGSASIALTTGLFLVFAASPASGKALKVPVPAAGDVTVAHVVFTTKGRAGRPRAPRAAKPSSVGPALAVVGGMRKAGAHRVLATFVVVRRASGSPGVKRVSLTLRLARGARFGRFVDKRVVRSVLAKGGRPSYCSALPASFGFVAAKVLAGKPLPGFSARQVAKYASWLGCRSFSRRAAFLASFGAEAGRGGRGGRDDGGSGGGSADSAPPCADVDETCPGDEGDGPAVNGDLRVTGSVKRDPSDPRRFAYSISFNQPVTGFRVEANGAVHCPVASYAAWYRTCSAKSLHPGYGLTCEQESGSSITEFHCSVASADRQGGTGGAPVPAGAAIDGEYTTDPDVDPPPGGRSVTIVGEQDGRESPPQTIPVS